LTKDKGGEGWKKHYRYLMGLAKNIQKFLNEDRSQGWMLFLFYDDSLERLCPKEWQLAKAGLEALPCVELHKFDWPEFRDAEGYHHGLMGTFARFLPLGDPAVEVVIVRDVGPTHNTSLATYRSA
jgi:hypothetical protein